MTSWTELLNRMHPRDVPPPEAWRRHYENKYLVAARVRPQRICEIGVRAGYSAFVFLQACPQTFLLGIDNDGNEHGGVTGFIQHARTILSDRDFALLVYDSQRLERLPGEFDLVHVDGDHTYKGTFHDLQLAWVASSNILVDDYALIEDVGRATDDFLSGRAVVLEQLDDKQLLIRKTAQPSSGEST